MLRRGETSEPAVRDVVEVLEPTHAGDTHSSQTQGDLSEGSWVESPYA